MGGTFSVLFVFWSGCGMGCETEVAREWNVGTLTMNKLSCVAETLVAREWQGIGISQRVSDLS